MPAALGRPCAASSCERRKGTAQARRSAPLVLAGMFPAAPRLASTWPSLRALTPLARRVAGGVKGARAPADPKEHAGGDEGGALVAAGALGGVPRPLHFPGHSPSSEHMAAKDEAPLEAIGGALADMEAAAGSGLSARRPLLPR